ESACGLTILSAAWSADPCERARIGRALAGGVTVALFLLAIERFGGEPITHWWHGSPMSHYEPLTRFDRGVTVLALLIWPLLFANVSKVLRILLAALVLGATLVMSSAAAMAAAFASVCIFAIARWLPRLVAGSLMAALIALSIGLPLAVPSYTAVEAL